MLMLMFSEDIYKSEATKPNQPNEIHRGDVANNLEYLIRPRKLSLRQSLTTTQCI